MRAVFFIVFLLCISLLIGWVQFSSTNGDATIRVDSDKIKQDTSEMIEKTKEVVGSAAKKVDATIDRDPIE